MSLIFHQTFPTLKYKQTTQPQIYKNNLKQISSKDPHNNISHKQHRKFQTQQTTK